MSVPKLLAAVVGGLVLLLVALNGPWRHRPEEGPKIEQSLAALAPEPLCLESQGLELPDATPSPLPPQVSEVAQAPSPALSLEAPIIPLVPLSADTALPKEVDRLALLFQCHPPQLPIVETITYSGRVEWLEGRPAYLGDYARHFDTSKHFISRSLHGSGQYLSDKVSKGDRFNVYRKDKDFEFHLVADLSRLKMWLYYYDKKEDARVLLKAYPISSGKLDPASVSGSLTPYGVFQLGREVAVYKPGVIGQFRGNPCEMITVFGRRWLPLAREVGVCTGPCKGLGIHGLPWREQQGEWVECAEGLGKHESEGCIRLASKDIEELFCILVARPAFIHIVPDFSLAHLPGTEREL